MKIGIITQPLRFNYGGILQNYALQTVLRRMGHNVVTLDGEVKSQITIKKLFIKQVKRIMWLLSNSDNKILGIWKYRSETDILSENTHKFIAKHITVQKLSKLRESDFDALIVGSDQVWRPAYSNLDEAYLSFAKKWHNIKRIAYAASFGTAEWEYTKDEESYCKELIKLFDAVSVREESGIILCREHFSISATHVLDPTLLLTEEDYESLIANVNSSKQNNQFFYYFLDDNEYKSTLLKYIEGVLGKASFTVNSKVEKENMPIKDRVQPPIEHWLQAFRDCSFVVTDSFHGCVFSLIFNKPFVVIVNQKRGKARFDFLRNFRQEHRMVFEGCDKELVTVDISLPNVDLEEMRQKSYNFITDNLNKNNESRAVY